MQSAIHRFALQNNKSISGFLIAVLEQINCIPFYKQCNEGRNCGVFSHNIGILVKYFPVIGDYQSHRAFTC